MTVRRTRERFRGGKPAQTRLEAFLRARGLYQLDVAQAIPNHKYGLTQFFIGQPSWEKYLKGEEPDIKKAAQAAKDAVAAENKKSP